MTTESQIDRIRRELGITPPGGTGPTRPGIVEPAVPPQRVSPDVALASPTMMQALQGTPPVMGEIPISVREAFLRVRSGDFDPEDVWALKEAGLLSQSEASELLGLFPEAPSTGPAGATWRPGEYDLMLQQLQEKVRQFNENLGEQQKSRALTSARDSLSAYLESSALADARRLKAFQETRALLPQVVPRNMQYAPGMGPGGPLAGVAQGLGAEFTPFEMQHVPVDPSQIARPAPINPQVMKAMAAMEALGAA